MSFKDWLFKAAGGKDEAISTYSEWLASKIKLKKKIIFPDTDDFDKWKAFTNGNAPKGVPGSRIRIAFRAAWSEYSMSVKPSVKSDDSNLYVESSLLQIRRELVTSNETVDETDNTVKIHKFVTVPARSGLSVGITIPIEEYNNSKVNVSINIPHYAEESEAAWKTICDIVEARISSIVGKVIEISGGGSRADIPDRIVSDREIIVEESEMEVVRERPKKSKSFPNDEELGIGVDRDLFAFDTGDENG